MNYSQRAFAGSDGLSLKQRLYLHLLWVAWYNVREHSEPSTCVAGIWRACANHDKIKIRICNAAYRLRKLSIEGSIK